MNFLKLVHIKKTKNKGKKYTQWDIIQPLKKDTGDFSGGPVVKTPSFHCTRCRVNPKIPHATECSQN